MSSGGVGGKLVGAAVVIVGVLGLKVYNKGKAEDEVRQHLVDVCDGEQACLDAVEEHYPPCFNSAYDMGGRRRAATLDVERLARCINEKSGVEWFAYEPDSASD